MIRFAALLPELILAIGGTVLMMVAAFAGRRGSSLVNWLAVALLIAATVGLIGAPSHAGPIYRRDHRRRSVRFVRQGDHLPRGRGRDHRRPRLVRARRRARVRICGPDHLQRGGDERDGLRDQPDFALCRARATSLASYVLAAYRRTDERSAEAGLKYFVLGALASGILLYGISLLYGFTGTMNFTGLAAAFGRGAPSLGLLFGLVFVLAGLAFKISAVPFHMWTPDVYEGAPTPVTAFFASAPKVAAVLLSTRLCLVAFGPATDAWRQIVIVAALASILLGAVAAYGQTNIKRLLAYSSINNVGFALIGLAAGGAQGASSVLFYMAVYVVMTLGAFLCVLWMRDEAGRPIEEIYSLSGLAQSRPAFAAAFAIFMFSLAGIPPLFGFWPKLLVFQAAVASGLTALAVAGILGTVVGAYYYLRIVKVMYMDEPAAPYKRVREPVQGLLILLAAIAVSPLGYLLIGPLSALTDKAAGSLF